MDWMYKFALEQSAIFATKLDTSFCIFRQASLERSYDNQTFGDVVTFSVNVVADIDMLYDYLDFLEIVAQQDFRGYHLLFFNLSGSEPDLHITFFDDTIEEVIPYTIVRENLVYGVATARSTRMDIALDDAFQYALTEISMYQDLNIRAMERGIEAFSEQAILIYSENVVSNVRFSEIEAYVSPLGAYTVKVTLVKDF
jgi:hypothetical protein